MSGGILSGLLGGMIGGDQAQMGTGILGNLNGYMRDNAGTLLGFGSGMLAGDNSAAAAGALQGMQADQRTRLLKQAEADKEQRKVQAQQLAQDLKLPPALASDPDTVFALAAKKYSPMQSSDITEYEYAKRQGYAGSFADWQTKKANSAAGGYGLTPQWGVDAQGNPVMLQAGRDGTAVQTKLPDGVRLSKEPIRLDAGTHFVLLDPITRQTIGIVPKDNAGAARDTAIGKATGEATGTAIAGADEALAESQRTIDNIEALKVHPGLEAGTGFSANLPSWMSTDPGSKKGFNTRVEQLKGQTFLQAYRSLKGAGAITDIEGQKAEAAIARLDQTQRKEDFVDALNELEGIVKAGQARLRQRVGGGGSAQSATQGIPSGSYNYVPGQGLVPAQ